MSQTFSVNNLISNLVKHNDIAKAERFNVNISLPSGLQPVLLNLVRDIPLQCTASELPGVAYQSIDYRYYGPHRNMPVQIEFGMIPLHFYCTADFWEKPFFEAWMDYYNPKLAGYDFRYLDEFVGQIILYQYDQLGNVIYEATLQRAYPLEIITQGVSWDANAMHTLSVMFRYTRYLPTLNYQNIVADAEFLAPNNTAPNTLGGGGIGSISFSS